uniref:Uncharacterized protein n=1 Tax=Chromera velia CCMP2878 TaxID=1169474 RepID=A0A0G4HX42_9ALVE|eukprot:Cvel_9184.t1-p1 / transcript=Cvel_9184.t1 / gene=Cvel_9184 / organism=Chromera_velia_CCMP2878 / gene_product=Ankyrin-2, putative / transcript_product=Ankyrin-2, putative / location=Cvel_scaffold523:42677-54417(-) / protein_length=908 / sequence_SO=supercontig / SO=protein_coding / is_pseudo=false
MGPAETAPAFQVRHLSGPQTPDIYSGPVLSSHDLYASSQWFSSLCTPSTPTSGSSRGDGGANETEKVASVPSVKKELEELSLLLEQLRLNLEAGRELDEGFEALRVHRNQIGELERSSRKEVLGALEKILEGLEPLQESRQQREEDDHSIAEVIHQVLACRELLMNPLALTPSVNNQTENAQGHQAVAGEEFDEKTNEVGGQAKGKGNGGKRSTPPSDPSVLQEAFEILQTAEKTNRKALHLAAERGSPEVLAYFADETVEDTKTNPTEGTRSPIDSLDVLTGLSALQIAVCRGSPVHVRLLVERGAVGCVEEHDSEKEKEKASVLHMAARGGDPEMAREILKARGVQIDARDAAGRSALMLAAESDRGAAFVSVLLDAGADSSLTDKDSKDLWDVSFEKGARRVLSVLSEKATLPSRVTWDPSWEVSLQSAVRQKSVSFLRALLASSEQMEARDEDDLTALLWAAREGRQEHCEILMSAGADANATTLNGKTALHLAVESGDVDTVSTVAARVDPNAQDSEGNAALHEAARRGDAVCLYALFRSGADPLVRRKDGKTPLLVAEFERNAEALHVIAEGMMEIECPHGGTLLHRVASDDGAAFFLDTVRVFAERAGKEFVNQRDMDGWTPLHLAVREGVTPLVSLLLEKGAEIDAKGKWGRLPLALAALNGHTSTASLLLKSGADVNARDNEGETALHLSVSRGHLGTLSLLLERGADLTATNESGWTALHSAALNHQPTAASVLLKRGADVDARDKHGRTPLHVGALLGDSSVLSVFLTRKAQVDLKDQKGMTPLHHAASRGDVSCVCVLLDGGAYAGAKDEAEWTPLHAAAQGGHASTASCLVQRGADLNAKDKKGQTPLHVAAEFGNTSIVSIFLEEGVNVGIKDKDGRTAHDLSQSEDLRRLLRT